MNKRMEKKIEKETEKMKREKRVKERNDTIFLKLTLEVYF